MLPLMIKQIDVHVLLIERENRNIPSSSRPNCFSLRLSAVAGRCTRRSSSISSRASRRRCIPTGSVRFAVVRNSNCVRSANLDASERVLAC